MPELRKDPIIGRWVIVSVEHSRKPKDFIENLSFVEEGECPFCAGKEYLTPKEILSLSDSRQKYQKSTNWQVRVIPSQAPLLRIEGDLDRRGKGVFDVLNGIGAHEVIVESPQHISNMADLGEENIALVITAYVERLRDLEKDKRFKYVLIFKNYGFSAGGGRIMHTRSQLIATPVTPIRVKEELFGSKRYFEFRERCVFCDLIMQEIATKQRVVLETDSFITITPFASRFPFEVWILPRNHNCDFMNLRETEKLDLAKILKRTLLRLKLGLNDPAYNMIVHTAPFRREKEGYWKTIDQDYHWHIEIMPRLIQVAGFEWGTGFYICPIAPEDAAQYLKEVQV